MIWDEQGLEQGPCLEMTRSTETNNLLMITKFPAVREDSLAEPLDQNKLKYGCENLRESATICENLRDARICENLREWFLP